MNPKFHLKWMLSLGIICLLTACGGRVQDQSNSQDMEENPNAARISKLEADGEALLKKINEMGNEWSNKHPEITDELILNDSLNAYTQSARMQLKKIEHELDSLKAL